MNDNDRKIQIEIHLTGIKETIKNKVPDVELYKLLQSRRSGITTDPEITMAVIAAGSVIIRQFLLSLFDYLKSKEQAVLKIKIGKNEFYIGHSDKNNDEKTNEIADCIEHSEEKVIVSKK